MGFRRIVNASPLILLSKVGCLDFLRIEADELVVPEQVIVEVRAHGLDDPTVRVVEGTEWLKIAPPLPIPDRVAAWNLGAGESAVLTLALSERACEVVLDDLAARSTRCEHGHPRAGNGRDGVVGASRRIDSGRATRPRSAAPHGFVFDG